MEVHVDDISSVGPPPGDCIVDDTVVCLAPGEGLVVVDVDDSLEVKFKTFCAALRA